MNSGKNSRRRLSRLENASTFVVPSPPSTGLDATGALPTDPGIQYFAGFADAELCFSWKRGPRMYQGCARVDCTNTYRPVLEMFSRRFGGRVYRKVNKSVIDNPRYRPCYGWTVTGARARNTIRTLLPYLVEKAEQARLILIAGEREPIDRVDLLVKVKALKKVVS